MNVKLSIKQRSELLSMLPKTGNIEKVKKIQAWQTSLELNEAELRYEKELTSQRDKEKADKSINNWLNEKNDFELDTELAAYLSNAFKSKEDSMGFSVLDDMELVDIFLAM